MVRRYGVISSRWSSHFWVKIHVFFPICLNNKSKLCTVFIYLLFFMKSTKNMPLVLRRSKAFKNRFEILQHIKNSTEEFHQPPASLSLNIPRWGVWICVYVRGLICFKSRIHYQGHMHRTLCWTHHRKYLGKKRFKKMEYRPRNCRGFLLST